MNDTQSAHLALAESKNNPSDDSIATNNTPEQVNEIPSTAISQVSSLNESLTSPDATLPLSQETSLSFQDESNLGQKSSRQRRHSKGMDLALGTMLDKEDASNSHSETEVADRPRLSPPEESMLVPTKSAGTMHHTVSPARKIGAFATGAHRLDTTAGQKRTVNGHVKTPTHSASPRENEGDARLAKDNLQRSPQIGQLTAQLRTRLSYAMVKVQKGWESKSISEVESLAGQQIPPKSATTENERLRSNHTPRIEASPERPSFMYSDIRTKLSPRKGLASPKQLQSPSELSSSSSSTSERQPITIQGSRPQPSSSTLGGPSLAPPVDLSPRNPRRSNPPAFGASKLVGKNVSNLSNADGASATSSARSVISATPPAVSRPLVRTPSQQNASAMEQDAIETLLYMSSPGNSQYRPSSQPMPPASQLRTVLSPGKRAKVRTIELNKATRASSDEVVPLSPRKKSPLDGANLENNENIDRLLDGPPVDESSSSEDDNDMELDKVPAQ